MKLFNSIGPNPRIVRMFLAEKKLQIEKVEIDLVGGENRKPDYLKINPAGQLPALQMNNGKVISEVTAICEYIEEVKPEPPLIGRSGSERAETRMWVRRIDLMVVQPMTLGFRYGEGADFFSGREPVFPEASQPMKLLAQEKMEWLNGVMEDKEFLVGDRFSLADIMLYCFVAFGDKVGQKLNPNYQNLVKWNARVATRPSAADTV